MGPRIESFNDMILEKMRLYHSRSTKKYLFMDLKSIAEVSP